MLDELVIGIRATAGGVREGVRTAQAEFKKLAKDKAELEKGLELKFKASGIPELQKHLAELSEKKKDLQKETKFKIASPELAELEKDLKDIDKQIRYLEKSKKINIDPSDIIEAEDAINKLLEDKKGLEKEIKAQVKVDAENAKEALAKVNKEILKAEREIRVKMQEEGITEAKDALHNLNIEMQETQRQSRDTALAMGALSVAAFKAFSTISKAVNSGVAAYRELESAQTRLSHIMGVTMEATSSQVDEIIRITQEYEKIGVISAQAQQSGAQELASYLRRTESLKALLPVLNDVTVQQNGFNASASQAVTAATMLGRVMEGQVGALSRWGYTFDEAQEHVIRFGTEAERVATIIDVIGASVGGVNEALGRTDIGVLESMATEADNLNAALGAAVVPMRAYAAEVLTPIIRGTREFIEENKGLVAGMSATSTAVLGVIAAYKAYQAAAAAKIAINATLAKSNKAVTASLGPIAIALTAIGAVGFGVFTALVTQAREARRELEEFEDVANRISALDMNIIGADDLATLDDAAVELRKLQSEMEKMEAHAETFADTYTTAAENIEEAYRTSGISIEFFAEKAQRLGVVYEETGNAAVDHANRLEAVRNKIQELSDISEQRRAELLEEAQVLENITDNFEEYHKAIDESIQNLQRLETAYDRLSRGEKLSIANMNELVRMYPQLVQYIAETGDLTLRNGDILREVAEAERNAVIATIRGNIERTETVIRETENRITAYEAEMRALQALITLSGEFDSASSAFLGNSVRRIQEVQAELNNLKNQMAQSRAELTLFESQEFGAARPSGGSGRAAAARDEARELYEIERQIFDDKVFFSEMSLREQIENLEALRERHQEFADGVRRMDREIFSLRRDLMRETYGEQLRYIEQVSAREGGTFDFSQQIELAQKFYAELMEVYAEYPQTVQRLTNDLDNFILRATENRTRKVAEMERAAVDEIRAAFEENMLAMRRMEEIHSARAGLMVDGEEQTFGTLGRLKWAEENLKEYDRMIAAIEAKGAEINEAERRWLEQLYRDRANVYQRIQVLTIEAEKEAQQQATRIFESALREREAALREHNRVVIAEIRERYNEEIRLAESAAAAEISIYEGRIREIENLLRAMDRAGQDEDQQDRIRRLQAQLSYEVDESNRYQLQKQISQEMADFEKRKRREGLEDERSALRDQISATRSGLADQRKMLQDARDAEIKMTEETLAAHIEKLAEQLKHDMEHNINVTKDFQHHLRLRGENTKEFYRAENTKARDNQTNNFNIVNEGTTRIVNMLRERVHEFANAGRMAGEAWAGAYTEVVTAAIAAMNAAGASGNSSGGFMASGFSAPMEVHMHQTINSPVASPSQVNRETERLLKTMINYM